MILDFLELHRAEQNEARHDLMLGLLDRVTHGTDNSGVRLWTLGGPGECATQTSPRNAIILGELNQSNSPLADETLGLDYPGVLGNDPVVLWFVERALSLATSQTGGRPRPGISRVWPRGRSPPRMSATPTAGVRAKAWRPDVPVPAESALGRSGFAGCFGARVGRFTMRVRRRRQGMRRGASIRGETRCVADGHPVPRQRSLCQKGGYPR